MFILPIIFVLSYAEMIPIDNALMEAEAKREDHIEEKTRHYDYESTLCSCVAFARTMRPDIPFINASDMQVSTTSPSVGAVVKMYYPKSMLYHVAIVIDVGEGWIRLDEANYKPCARTQRVITLPDRIIGYL